LTSVPVRPVAWPAHHSNSPFWPFTCVQQ
jgi:hypothetical protein